MKSNHTGVRLILSCNDVRTLYFYRFLTSGWGEVCTAQKVRIKSSLHTKSLAVKWELLGNNREAHGSILISVWHPICLNGRAQKVNFGSQTAWRRPALNNAQPRPSSFAKIDPVSKSALRFATSINQLRSQKHHVLIISDQWYKPWWAMYKWRAKLRPALDLSVTLVSKGLAWLPFERVLWQWVGWEYWNFGEVGTSPHPALGKLWKMGATQYGIQWATRLNGLHCKNYIDQKNKNLGHTTHFGHYLSLKSDRTSDITCWTRTQKLSIIIDS